MVAVLSKYAEVQINAADFLNCTPLHHAAGYARYEIAQMLLECQDIDTESKDSLFQTPLCSAISNKSFIEAGINGLKMASLLLERHADVNAGSLPEHTPLFCAIA